MSEHSQTDDFTPRDQARAATPASLRRRHLLKAALSTGPLIATLPSGAALAQSSAIQCAINEQESNSQPLGVVPSPDGYARTVGFVEVWPVGGTDYQVYHIGEEIFVYGDNSNLASAPSTGSWFDRAQSSATQPKSQTEAYFLYQFDAARPIEGPEDINVVTGGAMPGGCTIDPTVPPWPGGADGVPSPSGPRSAEHCFYPMAIRVEGAQQGNIPLAYSCLCSISPGAACGL